jgi:hypothetical protein
MAPQDKKTVEEIMNDVEKESDFTPDWGYSADECEKVAERYAAQQVTTERERIIGLVEEEIKQVLADRANILYTDFTLTELKTRMDTFQSLKQKLLNK